MPKVGGVKFPYTQAGMDKAKEVAKKSGKSMTMDPKKMPKGGKKK